MLTLPPQVAEALRALEAAGFEAYLVGGAVRDFVRGVPPHDWDLATNAAAGQVSAVFAGRHIIQTGLKHGTVTVVLDRLPLEITTFRGTSPTLQADLARRDFTVNAMAYSPRTGLLDPMGGQADLAHGRIRCVGLPDQRFAEDGLRVLRAARFASALGMEIEAETAAAMRRALPALRQAAPERIRTELTGLLCGPDAGRVLAQQADVAAAVLPELRPLFGFAQHNAHHDRDVWRHTLAVVDAVPPEPVLRWAALLHDVCKPACFTLGPDGVGHFYGHAEAGAQTAGAVLSRLRFDTAGRAQIAALIRWHDVPLVPERRAVRRLLRRLGEDTVRRLLQLRAADIRGQAPDALARLDTLCRVRDVVDALAAEAACFSRKDLAVTGRDLLALGLQGHAIGEALERCLTAVVDETLPNEREALLRYVRDGMPR